MPVVDGDWVQDFTVAGSTREVACREIVYFLRATSGMTGTLQAFVGDKWATVDTLTAAGAPKSFYSLVERQFKMIITGTGTATVVLSPDRVVPVE